MSEQIFLSRRNLLALLSKLDRKKAGDSTSCTVIKYQNPADPFVQSMDSIAVTAVEDEEYYTSRAAGMMHPSDEKAINPDVCTRDAPTPFVELKFDAISDVLFVGREAGKLARQHFDLDQVDAGVNAKVICHFPTTTYAISSSFFGGLLEPSIQAAGSREAFIRKYQFLMHREFFPVLEGVILRTLMFPNT